MTREELEKEAREAADKFRDLAKKATLYYISVSDIQVPHRESIGFERGFIAGAVAAAEPRERELEALRAELDDRDTVPRSRYWACNEDWLKAEAELDRVRGVSKLEIERLRARVAELEEMIRTRTQRVPMMVPPIPISGGGGVSQLTHHNKESND